MRLRLFNLYQHAITSHKPPYSPELNPIERLWAYLRSQSLSNRACDDDDHIFDASAEARQRLTPRRLRSVCAYTCLTHEVIL